MGKNKRRVYRADCGDLACFMKQDELTLVDDDDNVIIVHPTTLLYFIQEYQKDFKLTAHIDWSKARGIIGTSE